MLSTLDLLIAYISLLSSVIASIILTLIFFANSAPFDTN